jgi:hypothetical protein
MAVWWLSCYFLFSRHALITCCLKTRVFFSFKKDIFEFVYTVIEINLFLNNVKDIMHHIHINLVY